jgi:hypothetical protein
MRGRWWRRGWVWAAVLSGLFLAVIALVAANDLNWRGEARLWLGMAAFLAGASFEWLQLGARQYTSLIAVFVFIGLGWRLLPERIRAQVDWLAPVRSTAPALEQVEFEERTLPDPPPASAARAGSASAARAASSGGERPSAGRAARFSIEISNTEGEALELSYVTSSGHRSLGRIPGGAIQRFSIDGVPGSTIRLIATGAGADGGDTITRSILLDAETPVRVTLRRD